MEKRESAFEPDSSSLRTPGDVKKKYARENTTPRRTIGGVGVRGPSSSSSKAGTESKTSKGAFSQKAFVRPSFPIVVLPRDKIDVELVRELVHSLITMVVRSRDDEKEREDRRSSAVVASLIDFDTSSSKDREEREKSIIIIIQKTKKKPPITVSLKLATNSSVKSAALFSSSSSSTTAASLASIPSFLCVSPTNKALFFFSFLCCCVK